MVLFLGACQKDYYSIVMADGSCTQGAMTEACKDSMLRHFPIDHESFAQNPELENQVLEGLHLLMTAPLSFPKDKKMLGLATIKEAEMHDFYDRFVKEEGANLNQKMLNYILNAADKIKQGCSLIGDASYYLPDAIHICKTKTDTIYMASTLLHEARHSETGQHQAYIAKADTPLVPRGDIGMDGPCGWEVALLWGLMHGNDQGKEHLLDRYDIKSMIEHMDDRFTSITGLPRALEPVVKRKEFFADYNQHYLSIEQLSYPKAKTEIFFSKQPKTFPIQLDLSRFSLVLAEDLDQDGNADVVIYGTKGFQIFWGKKDQTLEQSLVFAKDVRISKIMTIKSPNTGTRDLVLVDYYGNMYLAPIEKTRTQPTLKKIITLPTIPRTVTVVDYNRDGKDDLLYQLYQDLDKIRILLGTGTQGVFTDKTIPLTGESTANFLFSKLYDVNKDGYPDLLYYSPYTGIKDPILVGMWQRNDTFQVQSAQTKILNFFRFGLFGELALFSSLNPFTDCFVMAERESSAFSSSEMIVRFFSIGTMGQLEPARRRYGISKLCNVSADSVLLFDLDQDGQEDLLFSARDARKRTMNLRWLTNVKDLRCDLSKTMEISQQDYEPQIALGDLDGDGYPEIVLVNGRRTFSVFYNQGPRVASLRP